MAIRKSKTFSTPARSKAPNAAMEAIGTVLATSSGPSTSQLDQEQASRLPTVPQQRLATQKIGAQLASAAVPVNPLKRFEFGLDAGHAPQAGTPIESHDAIDAASTVSEGRIVCQGRRRRAEAGATNPGNESLDRVRVDSSGQMLTTNMGIAVSDNQNSLKAGLRGPTLLEDFVLREKDHPLRPRAHPRAHRPCARLGGARLLRVLPVAHADHAGGRRSRPTASARRCSCASPPWPASKRLGRPRSRRARLRRQAVQRRKATGTSSATTSPCLLHPGRDQVSPTSIHSP